LVKRVFTFTPEPVTTSEFTVLKTILTFLYGRSLVGEAAVGFCDSGAYCTKSVKLVEFCSEPEDSSTFTSRYWDLSSRPLYPFGYGLSYTTFKFGNLRLGKNRISAAQATDVLVDVTNTGMIAGDAVAQIYIHQRAGSASRPVRQLKGFRRIVLQPGETKTLKFTLGKDELSFWSPQAKVWGVEPGAFDVWVGEDSTATLHENLTVVE
jgi:beta-glucosidase